MVEIGVEVVVVVRAWVTLNGVNVLTAVDVDACVVGLEVLGGWVVLVSELECVRDFACCAFVARVSAKACDALRAAHSWAGERVGSGTFPMKAQTPSIIVRKSVRCIRAFVCIQRYL